MLFKQLVLDEVFEKKKNYMRLKQMEHDKKYKYECSLLEGKVNMESRLQWHGRHSEMQN